MVITLFTEKRELNFKNGVWIQDTGTGFTSCICNNARDEAVSRTEEFSV